MKHGQEEVPFFSIIIPTYNRGTKVASAIKSILDQTYSAYEIIVVDDGSTDETAKVIEILSQGNARVKYFYKRNEERSIARNYGIDQARGKYIGFLDSDDKAYSNHLSVAHSLLQRNDLPEVGHLGYQLTDEGGNVISIRNNFDQSFKSKLIHENILHGNAIFIRRDIAAVINFIPSPVAIVSEDWYVWLRLAARYRFHFDNTITSVVIHHDERSLLNIIPEKLIASTDTIVTYLKRDEVFMKFYKRVTGYHFANHYTLVSLTLALTKSRRKDAMGFLWKAITFDPKVVFRKRFIASIKHLI